MLWRVDCLDYSPRHLVVAQIIMATFRDLSPFEYLPVRADHILAVGWLDGSSYATGPTPESVYQRLQSFAADPWQPFVAGGSHECELCQFVGERRGSANLYIPYDGRIFVAPALITHYINAHYYQPPQIFQDAVMACPAMDSMEYKRQLIACNAHILWRR